MPVGLVTERARQRERTIQIQLLAPIEAAARIRLAREFDRLGRELARMFRESEGTLPRLDDALAAHAEKLRLILNRLYIEVGDVIAPRIREAVGKSFGGRYSEKQALDSDTLFRLAMRQFIEGQSGARIAEITETTLSQLQTALATITEEGLGERAGAKLIREATGGDIAGFRARRIARTEAHTASQFASQTQIEQLNIQYVKRWVSVQDQRVRDISDGDQFDHKAANGQKRKRNERYDIKKLKGGTEALDFPGDPKGSPANIINCRCVPVYEVVR